MADKHAKNSAAMGREAVLAEFGYTALKSDDLDAILQEACRLVGRALGTDFAKVMELGKDNSLRVRAGVGWNEGIVGQLIIPAEDRSSELHAILTGEPVICEDITTDQRFVFPAFLREHGVRSMVNVAILGSGDRGPYGVLQVDSRKRRQFSDADINFLNGYANLLASSVDRLRLMPQLRNAIAKGDRLLRELQHRVKNNLQVITSLIQIQCHKTLSQEARHELQSVGQRIEALRLVHEKLYAAGAIDTVDLGTYLGELSTSLLRFQSQSSASARLESELQGIELSADVALPLGLVVNEFVTNSMKYAFNGTAGVIGIKLQMDSADSARLELWDNGQGLPKEHARTGTGMQLINGLIRQIDGTARWESDGGTRLITTFKIA